MFQAISITSTGYSSADFSQWPVFSQFVLLLLMIIGASAGSTGGGLKVLRIRIAFELAKREVMKIIQPRKVVAIRFNRSVVDEQRVWIILERKLMDGLGHSVYAHYFFLRARFDYDGRTFCLISFSVILVLHWANSDLPVAVAWAGMSIPSLLASTILMARSSRTSDCTRSSPSKDLGF